MMAAETLCFFDILDGLIPTFYVFIWQFQKEVTSTIVDLCAPCFQEITERLYHLLGPGI